MKTSLNVRQNPGVLLLFATFVLLAALALRPIAELDLSGMVMFGLPMGRMVWTIPLFLLSFWVLYALTRTYLYSSIISWLHVLLTVIATLLIVMVLYMGIAPSPATIARHALVGHTLQFLFLVLLLGQLMYVANVGLGIWKRTKAS
jgi:hypothetical protein